MKDGGWRVINYELGTRNSKLIKDIAASFQASVVDVLVRKTEWTIKKERIKRVTLTGGVAANSELRKRMKEMCEVRGGRNLYPFNIVMYGQCSHDCSSRIPPSCGRKYCWS